MRARLLLLALALLQLSLVFPVSAQSSDPVLAQHDDFVEATLNYEPSHYEIDVTMEPSDSGGLLTGSMHLTWVNNTDDEVDQLPFRLFANHHTELITVSDVSVAGNSVGLPASEDLSTLMVPFANPVAVEDSIDIELDFEATVPLGNTVHYGIFGIDTVHDTWALAHWHPAVAGWTEDEGFLLDPPSVNGDPIFTNTATYEVTVTAPESMVLVTTGAETDRATEGDLQILTFESGPSRDFTIVADDDFELTSIDVSGTSVNSWFLPGEDQHGEAVATYAARALEYFNEQIGPYPFAELDLLSVEVYGALGVEFPQLIYMARNYYSRDLDFSAPNALEFTVVHEVLHQWFYSVVGNNQYDHAFIDEGITNYLSGDLYFRAVYGDEAGAEWSQSALRNYYENRIDNGDDVIVDTPTDDFESDSDYVFAVYYKAAIGFSEIHAAIGEQDFFEALQNYYEDFAFDEAEPDDLLDAFEDASGEDLEELWELWFEDLAE